jgi:hypothetical protein
VKTLKVNIRNWSPVLVRGALWIVSSMLVAFLGQTEHMSPDKLQTWTWVDYLKLPINVAQAGILTAMAFMDQIIARHSVKLEAEGKETPPPIVTVTPQDPPKVNL